MVSWLSHWQPPFYLSLLAERNTVSLATFTNIPLCFTCKISLVELGENGTKLVPRPPSYSVKCDAKVVLVGEHNLHLVGC